MAELKDDISHHRGMLLDYQFELNQLKEEEVLDSLYGGDTDRVPQKQQLERLIRFHAKRLRKLAGL